jgi:hypothetical protein
VLRPPPGFPSPHRRERLHALFRSWPWLAPGLQRVAGVEPGFPLARVPTCSRFWPADRPGCPG